MCKTIVIGDGYVGSAFEGTYEVWSAESLYGRSVFKGVSNIIYTIDNKINDIRKNWEDNYKIIYDLVECGKKFNVKIIYISTADLYGNSWDWESNTETSKALDMNTDYRLSKRVAERALDGSNSLVLRIKNPFDNRNHEDNWLVSNLHRDKLFCWQDSYTYLPDLVNVCKILIEKDMAGIYNVVQPTAASVVYFYKNILKLPRYMILDGDILDNPQLNNTLDNITVHSDVNSEKISEIVELMPLEAAVILSWEEIQKHIDNDLFNGIIPYGHSH
jgi:dTDP-4-dehydrorhamnose reductase